MDSSRRLFIISGVTVKIDHCKSRAYKIEFITIPTTTTAAMAKRLRCPDDFERKKKP